jgi:hypothetical protein
VFIDKVLYGEFLVENNISGTASFSYIPFVALSPGDHLIYVSAVDERGKESAWSNIVYYRVVKPEVEVPRPTISGEAVQEENEGVEVLSEVEEFSDDNEVEIIDNEENINDEIKEILNTPIEDQGETSGAINEDRENQGKLRLNLAIFIIFLLSVIVWIFWVNRELIKERQDKTKKEN